MSIFDFRLPNFDFRVCDAFLIESLSAQPSRKSKIKIQQSKMRFIK